MVIPCTQLVCFDLESVHCKMYLGLIRPKEFSIQYSSRWKRFSFTFGFVAYGGWPNFQTMPLSRFWKTVGLFMGALVFYVVFWGDNDREWDKPMKGVYVYDSTHIRLLCVYIYIYITLIDSTSIRLYPLHGWTSPFCQSSLGWQSKPLQYLPACQAFKNLEMLVGTDEWLSSMLENKVKPVLSILSNHIRTINNH